MPSRLATPCRAATGRPPLGGPTGSFGRAGSSRRNTGTCRVNGFFDSAEAVKIIKECEQRYLETIDPKLVN